MQVPTSHRCPANQEEFNALGELCLGNSVLTDAVKAQGQGDYSIPDGVDGIRNSSEQDPSLGFGQAYRVAGGKFQTRSDLNFALLKGCREGDSQLVQQCVGAGAFLETRRPYVIMPKSGASPEREKREERGTGLTPLMYACQQGYPHIVDQLIKAKANMAACDEDGTRPLHFACAAGELEICATLISAGADPKVLDDEGKAPISFVPNAELVTRPQRQKWEEVLKVEAAPAAA